MMIPDKDMMPNDKFKGIVLIDDWFGNTDTQYIAIGVDVKNQSSNIRDGITTMSLGCYNIYWEICVGPNDNYCTQGYNTVCENAGGTGGGGRNKGVIPDYGGGGTGDTSSNPQPIIITLDDRLKYPTLAKIIDGLHDKVKNNGRLMASIKEFSHLSENEILENLKSGKGPFLNVSESLNNSGILGRYNGITSKYEISSDLATEANYFSTRYPTATEFFLTVIILHEFIHFGENTTQIFLPHSGGLDDAGMQFENKYYGGRIEFNAATGKITYKPL